MKPQNKYTITTKERKAFFAILAVFAAVVLVALLTGCGEADGGLVKVWILCKPGDYINVRYTPSKRGMEVGRLECGDWFLTDGMSANGFIRAYGVGEAGEAWIYAGYVSTEEPVPIGATYCCIAKNRVACRRWMDGPQTQNPWLRNGSDVQVFYIAGDWAITSRGFIKSAFLEADPQ